VLTTDVRAGGTRDVSQEVAEQHLRLRVAGYLPTIEIKLDERALA
jgi:hypothetical protein